MSSNGRTTVLQVGGLNWASSDAVIEKWLCRRPGVVDVQANAVSQTATVTYDPTRNSVAELTGWVRDCGYHCAGQSVPEHACDPMDEVAGGARGAGDTTHGLPSAEEGHASQEVMGHGGSHAGMSMDAMARDMRNRFWIAAVLSVPILL